MLLLLMHDSLNAYYCHLKASLFKAMCSNNIICHVGSMQYIAGTTSHQYVMRSPCLFSLSGGRLKLVLRMSYANFIYEAGSARSRALY